MVKTEKIAKEIYTCEICGVHHDSNADADECEQRGVKDHTLPIGALVTNPPMDMIFRVVEHVKQGHLKLNRIETIHGKTFGGEGFYEAMPHQIKNLKEWLEITMPKTGEVECPKCGKPVSPKWHEEALRRLCNQWDHDSDEGFDEEFE